MLYQIDIYLCSIITCFNSFFRGMNLNSYLFHYFSPDFLKEINILFCSNFAQLFSVSDNILYTLPVASKTMVAIIAKKARYDIFIETVMLIKVMQQQDNLSSICQFYKIFNQLQDRPFLSKN